MHYPFTTTVLDQNLAHPDHDHAQTLASTVLTLAQESYELIDVTGDEQLTSTETSLLLSGYTEMLYALMQSRIMSWRNHAGRYVADELCEQAVAEHLIEDHQVDDEVRELVEEAIIDRDTSEPEATLIENTEAITMVYRLGRPNEQISADAAYGDLLDQADDEDDPVMRERGTTLGAMLQDCGIDLENPANDEALGRLLADGPWDWVDGLVFELMVQARPAEVAVSNLGPRTVTVTDPWFLLIDRTTGAGSCERFTGQARVVVAPAAADEGRDDECFMIEQDLRGWTWERSCEPAPGVYRCEVTSQV